VHSIAVVTLVALNSSDAIMPTRSPVWSDESATWSRTVSVVALCIQSFRTPAS
jgi:hypothetical protein